MLRDGADPRLHRIVFSHWRSKRRLSDFRCNGLDHCAWATERVGQADDLHQRALFDSPDREARPRHRPVAAKRALPPVRFTDVAERAGGSYSQLAFGEINAKAVAAPLIPAGHLGAGVPEARLDIALVDLGKEARPAHNECPAKSSSPLVLRQIDANTGGQCRLLGRRAICLPAARRRRACCHENYGGRGTRALPPNSIQATGV